MANFCYVSPGPALVAIADQITTVDGIVDDILVDTGTTIPDAQAVTDGKVDEILVDTGTDIPAAQAVTDGKIDEILVDTGTDIPAAQGVTDGLVETVDAVVDAIRTTDVTEIKAAFSKKFIHQTEKRISVTTAETEYQTIIEETNKAGIIKAINVKTSAGASSRVQITIDGGTPFLKLCNAGEDVTLRLNESATDDLIIVDGVKDEKNVINLRFYDSIKVEFKSGEAVDSSMAVNYSITD